MKRILILLAFCPFSLFTPAGAEEAGPGRAFTPDEHGLVHIVSRVQCPSSLSTHGAILVRWRATTHVSQTGICQYVAFENDQETARLIMTISAAPVAAGASDSMRALMIAATAGTLIEGPEKTEIKPGVFQIRPNAGRFSYEFGGSRLYGDHLLNFMGGANEARRAAILEAIDRLSSVTPVQP